MIGKLTKSFKTSLKTTVKTKTLIKSIALMSLRNNNLKFLFKSDKLTIKIYLIVAHFIALSQTKLNYFHCHQ